MALGCGEISWPRKWPPNHWKETHFEWMNDWGGAVNVCGAINVSGAVIIQGGGQYALGNQRLWGNQCLYDSKDPLKPPLQFFFRSAKVAITRSCWFFVPDGQRPPGTMWWPRSCMACVVCVSVCVCVSRPLISLEPTFGFWWNLAHRVFRVGAWTCTTAKVVWDVG